MSAYLGLDVGGTGAKAGVFDPSGTLIGFGHAGYAPHISPEGHAEIPIEDIHQAARQAVREAVRNSGANIRGMAVSSQGQTFVALDERDQPVYPAIIWYDSRAAVQAAELERILKPTAADAPLPSIDALASAVKVMWLREKYPERMSRALRFLLLPDYFAHILTGRAVTDPSTAASTGLYAEDTPTYSEAALKASGIARTQLAEIQSPGSPIGVLLPGQAQEWGLQASTLLCVGTNDQYAGALGAGNCRPRILSETTGTCLALVTLAESLPAQMPSGLFAGRFPIERYQFVLAYSKTAGLVLDWFRREVAADTSWESLERMAAEVPPGCRGLTALPHFDGTISPVPNASARGAFYYLSLQHTRADLFRALLESLAFALKENLALIRRQGLDVDVIRSIGGGAKSALWLQIKADVLGLPVEKPAVTEAAVLGAAMLAAMGCGEFKSLAESSEAFYRVDRVFQPDSAATRLYQPAYERYRELKFKLYGEPVTA